MVKITKDEYMQMYRLIGAAMEVYNTLGRGMEEPIYQEAMQYELEEEEIPFEREKPLHTYYKGRLMEKTYFADFYSGGVVVEFKSVDKIIGDHRAQLMNYMRITKSVRGILVNFGEKKLHTERYLYDQEDDDFVLLNESNFKDYIKQKIGD